jgi:hypothetical protein
MNEGDVTIRALWPAPWAQAPAFGGENLIFWINLTM